MVFVLAFIVAVVGLLLGGGTGAVLLATTVVLVLFGLVMLGASPEARNERQAAAVRRARGRAVSERTRQAKGGRRSVGARSNGSGSSGD
ncbi:hypothetical protein [Nocardia sp. XZ_19_231]|uniref:hypothetical protein n=1 Tax=Nocardia sp. XZ_19_231 TaxID=2769252 RepID=UPI001890B3AC|nr:hypothetical protein [Nocardia sp. XZ_19_231]